MKIILLGAGAGGGLPQWNCGCDNCNAARAGRIPAMTQSSVAVSADGRNWAILNASPDIRVQLAATPALHPTGLRDMPLHSVLVTNGDIDHVAGLLTLRESQAFVLYATPAIHGVLADNPMLGALRGDLVARELAANGRRALYIPGCAELPGWLVDRIGGADLLMFDGTLWDDDEMIRMGLGQKTGRRMGHMPVVETIAAMRDLPVGRRVFVHMNNSNPLTDPASVQTREAEASGWQVGRDGMEITL